MLQEQTLNPEMLDQYDILEYIEQDKLNLKNAIADLEVNASIPHKAKSYVINRYYAAINEMNYAINEVSSINSNSTDTSNDA